MSTLWTPQGEHEPPREPTGEQPPQRHVSAEAIDASPEELEAMRELHARLSSTPVADMIANHALGIWQLALIHLGVITPPDATGQAPQPDFAAAGLAIDALASLADGLGPRLGEHEQVLRDALAQAQAIYVQLADARGAPDDAGAAT